MKKIVCSIMTCLMVLGAVAMLASCDDTAGGTSSEATSSATSATSTFQPTDPNGVSVESGSASDLISFDPYDPGLEC